MKESKNNQNKKPNSYQRIENLFQVILRSSSSVMYLRELLLDLNFIIYVIIQLLYHIQNLRISKKPNYTHIGYLLYKKSSTNLTVSVTVPYFNRRITLIKSIIFIVISKIHNFGSISSIIGILPNTYLRISANISLLINFKLYFQQLTHISNISFLKHISQ